MAARLCLLWADCCQRLYAKLAKKRIPANQVIESDMLISHFEHGPVSAYPRDYLDGAHQSLHLHREAQLLYAVEGSCGWSPTSVPG